MTMRRVCVFCGSRPGARPDYLACAQTTGRALAERGIGLVYGGAAVGTMGALADAALAGGGEVIGVMPRALVAREIAHRGLTEMHEVDSMHARKALMVDLADGFIVLPGGSGTMDEFFEVFTWAQLGFHRKPIGIINVSGFYQPVLDFFARAVADGFVPAEHRQLFTVADSPAAVLDGWDAWQTSLS